MKSAARWNCVCEFDDILPHTGVCVDLKGKQIAVFRVDDRVYALDNHDPASGANVLSRGIVGDIGGELVVASPIYKQHFTLTTGRCLEDADLSVTTYPVRLVEDQVWLRPEPIRLQRAAGRR
ncbi:MAG: nitrite reductase small subunit NirD, partial [Steroidobacteraceae bacterium]